MRQDFLSFDKDKLAVLCLFILGALSLPLSKSLNTIIFSLLLISLLIKREGIFSIHYTIKEPLLIAFILYLSIKIIGLFYTQDLEEGLRRVKGYLNLPFVYFVTLSTIHYLQEKKNIIYGLMAYICGVALLDIAGLISSKFQFYGPFSSLGMHHIWFGNLNALAFYGLMALLFMSWEKRKTHLLISASLIILFLFSLIMSTSRTAWLGIMVSLCVVSFMLFRRKRQFWYVATGLLMVVVIFYFTVPVVKQRVSQVMMDINAFLSGNEATSIGARFTMWIASLKIFLNNPLFGAGTGDYNIEIENLVREGEIPPFISRYNQPHSIYMNELATNGLLGFIALVYIFIKPLILSKKEKGSFNILLWLVLVHYMVAGLTESLFNIHVLINSFAFLLGLVRRWENSNLKRPLMQNQLDIKSS